MRLHGISQDAFDRYVSQDPGLVLRSGGRRLQVQPDRHRRRHRHPAAAQDRPLPGAPRTAGRRYDQALAGLPLRLPPRPDAGSSHAWHLYVVRLSNGARLTRDELIASCPSAASAPACTSSPCTASPTGATPAMQQHCSSRWPKQASSRMLTLPLYTKMSDADQQRVITALNELLS
jgi:hypothetical protein